MVLALVSLASAASVTEAEVTSMIAQLAPRVEDAAGRAFDSLPTSAIDDRAHVLQAMEEVPPLFLADAGTSEAQLARHDANVKLLAQALAIYDANHDRIYLVSDALRELFRKSDANAAMVRPYLRCVIAHELTHALQRRYVGAEARIADDGHAELAEGHAEYVASQVCDPAALAYFEASGGADILPSVERFEPTVVSYALGRLFTAAYVDAYGVDGMWWRLGRPAPTLDTVTTIVRPTLPGGWLPSTFAKGLAAGWQVDGTSMEVSPISGSVSLATINGYGVNPVATHDRPSTALAINHVDGDNELHALTILFTGAEEPGRAVKVRRETVNQNLRAFNLLTTNELAVASRSYAAPIPPRRLPTGATASLEVNWKIAGEPGRYHELWVARGPILYVIAHRGPEKRNQADAWLAALMAQPVEVAGRPITADAVGAAAFAAEAPPKGVAATGLHGEWQAWRLRGKLVSDPGGEAQCLNDAKAAMEGVGAGRQALVAVAAQCAMNRSDVDGVERVSAWTEAGEDWDHLNLVFALSLAGFGRADAAATALAKVEGGRAEERASAELALAVARRRWAAVGTGVADRAADVRVRMWAAEQLVRVGRQKVDTATLRGLCAEAAGDSFLCTN